MISREGSAKNPTKKLRSEKQKKLKCSRTLLLLQLLFSAKA
jgi:hypothetical protein